MSAVLQATQLRSWLATTPGQVRAGHPAWAARKSLRELIARNLIAPGDVDVRSIEVVQPSDLAGYTQCHFFAGIGLYHACVRTYLSDLISEV